MEVCPVCNTTKLVGEIIVVELPVPESFAACGFKVVIGCLATPDRNWIICDACNLKLCHRCCTYPQSGYCDPCIARYQLAKHLRSKGILLDESKRYCQACRRFTSHEQEQCLSCAARKEPGGQR